MKTLLATISKYEKLKLEEVFNFQKFNLFAITAHSTQLEGSTLTLEETQLFLDENISPGGKPLEHILMVKDHQDAMDFVISEGAKDKLEITPALIQKINAMVMKSSDKIVETVLGKVDCTKGEYRKSSVIAGTSTFPSHTKIDTLIKRLCDDLNNSLIKVSTKESALELSYAAHFHLVSIHPFYDGNGRTSRLLMNLIQQHYKLPLSTVYKEDKLKYFESLKLSRQQESLEPIIDFMSNQHNKFLTEQMQPILKAQKKKNTNDGFSFFL